ncbi:MAG: GAK system ATP-grasp enzyme [candidate division Zixibacteria bacterium]|nr:GAK system ATP-grasp enzyme [candidate division Zixibacteria bacterium]
MKDAKDLKIGVVGIEGGWSSTRLTDAVSRKAGKGELVQMNRVCFNLEAGKVLHEGHDLMDFDALIVKKIGSRYSPHLMDRMEILRFLKNRGLRIFSKPASIARAIDRLSCTSLLMQGDIPIPPTVITENISEAVRAVERFGQAVLKPMYTSKARGMMLLESGNGVYNKVESFQNDGNPVIYVQKKMTLPGRDLGLVFLGGRYLGTYARVSNGESWNTSTRSGGRYEPYEPAKEIIKLAEKAQALFDLDFTSVDIAETPEGPVIFEVSAFGGFRGLLEANKIDAAELYTDYVLKELTK